MKRLVISALALAMLSGCGTIGGLANDDYPGKVYVGVRHDARLWTQSMGGIPGWLITIWDFPFSFGLDTAFLPGTLVYELFRSKK
jgi:uncharacterized protein YceK